MRCLTWCRCCSRIDVLAVIPRSDDTMFWLLVLASSSLFLLDVGESVWRFLHIRSYLPWAGVNHVSVSGASLLSRAAFSTSHFFLSSSAVISASHFSSRLLQSFPPLCCLTWCRCCSRLPVLAVIPRSDDTMFWLLVLASSSLFLLARTGCLRSELPLVGRAKLAFLASVSLAQEFRKLG